MLDANKKEEKPFTGTVEVDETYIGGKSKNRHKNKRFKYVKDTEITDKSVVMGMLERGGKVRCEIVANRRPEVLLPILLKNMEGSSTLMSDEWNGYGSADLYFTHKKINNSLKQYADGEISTNGVENFWSILKRGIIGVYHHASKKHLNKYVQEFVFRFNTRNLGNRERIELLLKHGETRIKRHHLKRAA
jgi:transposase-like protein